MLTLQVVQSKERGIKGVRLIRNLTIGVEK